MTADIRLARRLLVAAGILGAAWAAPRRQAAAPPAEVAPSGSIVYADVAGWYERTPDEVAVLARHDLSLAGLERGLPATLGHWTGADRPPDPSVPVWFGTPDVALERTYRRPDGAVVWLSAFGSRGDASFHLFEHTPETCYPLSGWAIESLGRRALELGPRPLTVNFGRARGSQGAMAFLYIYLWDSPDRDPARGVVSLRLAAPSLPAGGDQAAELALVDDFMGTLFQRTLSWTAF